MTPLTGSINFTQVPLSIDLFISHPLLSKILSLPAFPVGLVLIIILFVFYLIQNIITHKKYLLFLASSIFFLFIFGIYLYISPLNTIARNPSSSTIIAAIVVDKEIIDYLLFKQYYIIVDIDGTKHGVLTNKDIYSNSIYKRYATFDYTLYTYIQNGNNILYRFCRPENKVKVERGNIQ